MQISDWMNLEMHEKQRALVGRFYLDSPSGTEYSPAATITEIDNEIFRIDVYRYVVFDGHFGGSFFMPKRKEIALAKELADAILHVFSADDGNESWHVWKLELRSPKLDRPSRVGLHDEFPEHFVYVVVAQTESEARNHACALAGDKWAGLWADENETSCERIGRSEKREDRVLFPVPTPKPSFVEWFIWRFTKRGDRLRVVATARTAEEASEFVAGEYGDEWADPKHADLERFCGCDVETTTIVCGPW